MDQLPFLEEVTFTYNHTDRSLYFPFPNIKDGSGRAGEFVCHRLPDGKTGPVWFRHLEDKAVADVDRASKREWALGGDPPYEWMWASIPDMVVRVCIVRLTQEAEAADKQIPPQQYTLVEDFRDNESTRMALLRTHWRRIVVGFDTIIDEKGMAFLKHHPHPGYRLRAGIYKR